MSKHKDTHHQSSPTPPIAVTVNAELKQPQTEIDAKRTSERQQVIRDKIRLGIETITLLAIIIGAGAAIGQLKTIQQQLGTSEDTLQISQRAYVTVGRKDGVIGDFVIPKDPTQNAEVVIYFQNSGHLPAKFAWGTLASLLAVGSEKKSTGITYTHPFNGGFGRTKNKKDGSIGEQGESTIIAGDSVLISTLGTISQKDLAELPAKAIGTLVLGMFQYCDELGNYSTRNFALRFRSNAPSSSLSFDLADDIAFPMPPLPNPSTTTEYLLPCETSSERQNNQNRTSKN